MTQAAASRQALPDQIKTTLGSGLAWNIEDLYSLGDIRVAAVPEPGNAGMMLAGQGLVGVVVRAGDRFVHDADRTAACTLQEEELT